MPLLARIFVFWLPLSLTWLAMSLEGPTLAAIIARLDLPKENLAAYGVAFSIALIIEAPVIMMLSASTALVEDASSYRRLRLFAFGMSAAISVAMLVLLIPEVFHLWAVRWMNLPETVAKLTQSALFWLLPWPGAIGYRRFFQGLMIRQGKTRRVFYGTLFRLSTTCITALNASLYTDLPGASIGAIALSSGVCVEAVISRWMARPAVAATMATQNEGKTLSYLEIFRFYTPLAATSFIGLAAQPITTFFMARAENALESMAVLPVVTALIFIFRSPGLAFQETAITFLAKDRENAIGIFRFTAILASAVVLGLGLIALTPLSGLWFRSVSGLSENLANFAWLPTIIMVPIPALSVLLSFQRAMLVHDRRTMGVTIATGLELIFMIGILGLTIHVLHLPGAVAAAIAFVSSRLIANAYLVPPCLAAKRRL